MRHFTETWRRQGSATCTARAARCSILLLASLCSCTLLYPLDGDAIGTPAVADASTDSDAGSHDASDAPTTPDAPPMACNAKETPVVGAIFVSNSGGSDSAAGTSASPLKTLAKATQVATAAKVAHIYIDEGTYGEVVTIDSAMVLHGGWQLDGASWTRDCREDARLHTLVNPPSASVVKVTGFTGNAGIENVTLVTNKAAGDFSESMIALAITSPGVHFSATNIDVTAAAGGDGLMPFVLGDPGAVTCNGHSGCSSGLAGSVGPDGSPAQPGQFQLTGFVAGGGQEGQPGTPGANGTAGGDGQTESGCESCGPPPACASTGTGDVKGGTGSCGCGGKAGVGGPGGRGGGASVGIFAAGAGTTLTIAFSTVRASAGGKGSDGRAGPGGSGTKGASGTSTFCGTCIFSDPVCGLSGNYVGGGSAGGKGGDGGPGGKGGGGAGGPSYGIVTAAGATAVIDVATQSAITPGMGGAGADGAPSGASGSVLKAP